MNMFATMITKSFRLPKVFLPIFAAIALLAPVLSDPATAATGTPVTDSTGKHLPDPFRAAPPSTTARELLSAALDTTLRRAASATYAGYTIGPHNTIQVFATAPDVVLNEVVARKTEEVSRTQPSNVAMPAVLVTTNHRHSLATLEQVRNEITTRARELRARGIPIDQWGVDISTNRVHIGVQPLTVESKTSIQRLFGADRVEVNERPALRAMSRGIDWSPWWGGDGLSQTPFSVPACTGGFNYFQNRQYFISTAGHCQRSSWYSLTNFIGDTTQLELQDNGPADAQLISVAGAQGMVYTSDHDGFPVGSYAATQAQGETGVCIDGSFSGESCILTITATNQCDFLQDVGLTICNLIEATAPLRVAVPGDSGAPVYNYSPDLKLNARGMFVAANGGGDRIAYSPIPIILQVFGVDLLMQ